MTLGLVRKKPPIFRRRLLLDVEDFELLGDLYRLDFGSLTIDYLDLFFDFLRH